MPVVEGAGVELAYEETGTGPAVVLVHGMADDRAAWPAEIPGLRTIAYDRRGYGESSAPEPYDRTTVGIVRSLRMANVLWSVDSQDYTRPGRKAIVRKVLSGVRPGAIVLMHDGGGDRSQTVAALRGIIVGARARGLRFVSMADLLGLPAGALMLPAASRRR